MKYWSLKQENTQFLLWELFNKETWENDGECYSSVKTIVATITWWFVTDSSVTAHACVTGFTGEPATFDHQVLMNNTNQEVPGIDQFYLYLNMLVTCWWVEVCWLISIYCMSNSTRLIRKWSIQESIKTFFDNSHPTTDFCSVRSVWSDANSSF